MVPASAEAGQTAYRVSFPPAVHNAAPDRLHAAVEDGAVRSVAEVEAPFRTSSTDAFPEVQAQHHGSGILAQKDVVAGQVDQRVFAVPPEAAAVIDAPGADAPGRSAASSSAAHGAAPLF